MRQGMHYMYRITNQLSGKVYIGQSINPEDRWKQHQSYSKNPSKTGQYIHRAIAKHGVEHFIFEVIATCRTIEDANETEVLLIQQHDSRNKEYGYNIKPGGETWDDKMRQFMSEKIKQHYLDHPEDRERVAAQAKMLWQNPDHIAKMKKVPHPNKMKGQSISKEQRINIIDGVKHLKGVKKGPLLNDIKKKVSDTKKNFSQEKKEEIANKINASRGQVVLSKEHKQLIANDSRSSYIIASEYGVNASTIQRIKKNFKNES
jgi:group I intron endonuclease